MFAALGIAERRYEKNCCWSWHGAIRVAADSRAYHDNSAKCRRVTAVALTVRGSGPRTAVLAFGAERLG
jgi:hypothetical protein